MKKEKILLPSVKILEQFRRDFLRSHDPAEIDKMVDWFLAHYRPINISAKYTYPHWRARKCQDESGFQQIKHMMHPPASITTQGRMNDEGCPLLYLSGTVETALSEIKSKPGDLVHVIGIKELKPPRLLVAGEMLDYFRGRPRYLGSMEDKITRILHDIPEKPRQSFIYLDALAAEIFRSPAASTNGYMHSRSLARKIMEKLPELDGIGYPSIALLDSANTAMKPCFSSSGHQVVSSSIIRITGVYTYGTFEVEVLKTAHGHTDDGYFKWSD